MHVLGNFFFLALRIFFLSSIIGCRAAYTKPTQNKNKNKNNNKRIVFIRHGCTYANEYLAQPDTEWGAPTFADNPDLRDSPLSPTGVRQALRLRQLIVDQKFPVNLKDIDMVVVSPLSRTLQTFELSLFPELRHVENDIPVVALPLARERLYMMSDLGLSTADLKVKFPWADFDREFDETQKMIWWYHRGDEEDCAWEDYKEWRPHGQGQTYLVPGEPDDYFEERMLRLYKWLEQREEKTIAVVCHWGVLQWLTGIDFDNCEVKAVEFNVLANMRKSTIAEQSLVKDGL